MFDSHNIFIRLLCCHLIVQMKKQTQGGFDKLGDLPSSVHEEVAELG